MIPTLLILLGGLLRFFFSAIVGLNPEDSIRVTFAEVISFNPEQPYLLYWAQGLPLVGLYLLKLAHSLFGNQILLLRLPWILASALTLGLLYRLVHQALGKPQAILATFLLAIDQFHLTWTRTFYPDILVIAAQIAFLTLLWKILCDPTAPVRLFLLLGLIGGVGYHSKKTFLLALLATVIYLTTGPLPRSHPHPRAKLWLTLGLLAILILPSITWEIFHPMENHFLNMRMTALRSGIGIDLTPFSLYLGEPLNRLRPGMLEDYWNWHTYPVHWVAGGAYLSGVGLAFLHRRQNPFIALMLTQFATVSIFFLFLRTDSLGNHFWWGSLSLIPAIALAADRLTALWRRSTSGRIIVLLLGSYLTLRLAIVDYSGGLNEPIRSPQEWAALQVESGLQAMAHRRYGSAYDDLLWASKLDPKNGPLKEWVEEAFTRAVRQTWNANPSFR